MSICTSFQVHILPLERDRNKLFLDCAMVESDGNNIVDSVIDSGGISSVDLPSFKALTTFRISGWVMGSDNKHALLPSTDSSKSWFFLIKPDRVSSEGDFWTYLSWFNRLLK